MQDKSIEITFPRLLEIMDSIEKNDPPEHIFYPIRNLVNGRVREPQFSLESYFNSIKTSPMNLNWALIEKLINDDAFHYKIAHDYVELGDASFSSKHSMDRADLPENLIIRMLLKEEFGYQLVKHCDCNDTPTEVLTSGAAAKQYPEKYTEHMGNLFDSVVPNIVTINTPPHSENSKALLLLSEQDGEFSSALSHFVREAEPLEYAEMVEGMETLRVIAEENRAPKSDEEYDLYVRVIKTALHYGIFRVYDIEAGEMGTLSKMDICLSCLALFGYKIRGVLHEVCEPL